MTPKFIDCPAFLAELYTGDLTEIVPDLEINVGSPEEAAVIEMLDGCALAVNDHTYMPESLLKACPALKVIVFMGTGASSYIDVAAAERLNIGVRTIAGYGDRSVAEHAIALMFAGGRQIAAMDHDVRKGVWETLEGVEFAGKTLGIVGTGGIGKEVCRLGDALGMKVIAWNRSGVPGDLPCESRELDALLGEADVISLHLSLTEETRGMIDKRRFGLMKRNAILINTARGGVVDEAAMVDALQQRRIAHAGLDVFEPEPLPDGHVLTTLDNVTLTSHAAFMTKEASSRLLRMALEILREERRAISA